MIGMNFFIHIAAVIVTVVLVQSYLGLKRRRDFALELLSLFNAARFGQSTRVFVDQPQIFLTRFAAAFSIPLSMTKKLSLPFRRLNPVPLVELFLMHGLHEISLSEGEFEDTKSPIINVKFVIQSSPTKDLETSLSLALGPDIKVFLQEALTASH